MIRMLEELAMNAWPSLQTQLYDGWVLRFADGYSRRANSINPIYTSSVPLSEKITVCEDLYRRKQLPVIYKITPCCYPENLDRELENRDYAREAETALRTLDMQQYRPVNISCINIENGVSDAWMQGFYICSNTVSEMMQSAARKILDNIVGEIICVSKVLDGEILGCGLGVIEHDHMGIFDIVVHKEHRGQGYGREIMHAILNTGAQKGIKNAYLQVFAGNVIAENLYESLGFKEQYRYWYRVKN